MSQIPNQTTLQPEKTRVLTGIKPTADLHLGNFVGAIKPCVEFSKDNSYEVILMCADWHGLTDRQKIKEPGVQSLSMMAAFLACGYEVEKNSLILQSHFPIITEIAWYLSCVSPVGMMERAHAYKDAIQNGKKPTNGLFQYPILMSSDILSFDSQIVPVGKDQAQHLEYASDIAKLFNNAVEKEVLIEPKPILQETPLIIGIDGEKKMSKSYDNYIPLFASKKEIEKRIKSIKTDSKGLDEVKDPETCAIFLILKSFASQEAIVHMKEKLLSGKGYGYGHAKLDLLEEYERVFGPHREKYDYLVNHPKEIWEKLEPGYLRAQKYAENVLIRVRDSLGLLKFQAYNSNPIT